jgi:hypothetical protein
MMSERTVATIRRGMDYTFVLASALGEVTAGYTCTSDIKSLPGGVNSYSPSADVILSYAVTTFPGDSTRGPGWYLTLTDEDTLDLAPGTYMADARVTDGTVTITESWVLQVVQTVTQS